MVLRRGWGDSPPPSLDGPSGFAGNELRDYKSKSGTGLGHLNRASCPEKLLEAFEQFQVEQILSEIKKEWVLDPGVSEFGELLEEERKRLRQRLKGGEKAIEAAQAGRATYVREHWTPGCYPQLTTDWFIEGLDFCWTNWHHQFKRPLTPPPAPPPSPDASRKTRPTMLPLHVSPHQTPHHDVPAKRRRR